MRTEHTPGQWTLSKPSKNYFNVTQGPKGFVIAEVTNQGVIQFLGNEKEAEANAKLITAAPELLKALNDAVKFINLCPHLSDDQRPKGLEKWEKLIEETTSTNH